MIIQDGLRRMYAEQQDVYYYLTVMNENYAHPAMPEGAAPDIIKGMYLFRPARTRRRKSKGAARAAARLGHDLPRGDRGRRAAARSDWGVDADLWGCPCFTELARDGYARRAAEHAQPDAKPPRARTSTALPRATRAGRSSPRPITCARSPSRSARSCRAATVVLGTDGFGRSDTREKLRRFFEVDRHYIAVAALKALADDGDAARRQGRPRRSRKYGIDAAKPAPWTV